MELTVGFPRVFDFFQLSVVRGLRRAPSRHGRKELTFAAFQKTQNALTRPSPPLIINSFDKSYIIVKYLKNYAIFLLARIMYRRIFADKKDPILKFSFIWSYTGDRNLNFRYQFFFKNLFEFY